MTRADPDYREQIYDWLKLHGIDPADVPKYLGDGLRAELEAARARLAAQQPLIDAAIAWRHGRNIDAWLNGNRVLVDAVDVYEREGSQP